MAGMIGIAPWEFHHYLLIGLVAWAVIKSLRYARPLRSFLDRRTYRWTIADWLDTTFWIAIALGIIRALAAN